MILDPMLCMLPEFALAFWLILATSFTCADAVLVIFVSLAEAPLPDPAPTPPRHPEKDPKQTRNRPEAEPNGPETEPNGAELDRNQSLSGGTAGGVCRHGGRGGMEGVVREKENHYAVFLGCTGIVVASL